MRPVKNKHEFNSAMIGIILGDGSMSAENVLYIRHGGKQLNYVNSKVEYLNNYIKPKSLKNSIDKKGYNYRYAYYNTFSLKYLYNLIYKNNKKTITKKLLNRFTNISLAFFYMDDGCLSLRKEKKNGVWTGTYKSREIHLNTQSFSFHEVKMFVSMLKSKFNLDFHLTTDKGNPRIWCNTKNTLKMLEIISPIIKMFPEMHYKLDLKYKNQNISFL